MVQLELINPAGTDVSGLVRVVDLLNAEPPEWLPSGTINLKFVDEAESQTLNKQYSGNDYATDVLTFDYHETGEPVGEALADVAICLPIAEAQAKQAGTSLPEELALLALHAILHVAGLDHAEAKDRHQVDELQTSILKAANITYRDFKWEL